jgi:hypothetical protein
VQEKDLLRTLYHCGYTNSESPLSLSVCNEATLFVTCRRLDSLLQREYNSRVGSSQISLVLRRFCWFRVEMSFLVCCAVCKFVVGEPISCRTYHCRNCGGGENNSSRVMVTFTWPWQKVVSAPMIETRLERARCVPYS